MAQNVSIVGTITIGDETKQCTISGVGAIVPVDPGYVVPDTPRPPGAPGVPTHPIYYPPEVWPPPGGMPHPEHPIVLPPDPPTEPPTEPPTNPPNPSWVWGWTPKGGGMWVPVYVPGPGQPGPKKAA